MHSPLDKIVGIYNASAIFAAARHPKSFISLDDADHLLARRADAEYAAAAIAGWAGRYLPAMPATAGSELDAAEGGGVVGESGGNPFRAEKRRVGERWVR